MLRIEQNLPARSWKRGEAPIPRLGKGLPGFGIEHAPSRVGVSALDHQATPTANEWLNELDTHQAPDFQGFNRFWSVILHHFMNFVFVISAPNGWTVPVFFFSFFYSLVCIFAVHSAPPPGDRMGVILRNGTIFFGNSQMKTKRFRLTQSSYIFIPFREAQDNTRTKTSCSSLCSYIGSCNIVLTLSSFHMTFDLEPPKVSALMNSLW
jgi:hypothetical protein